MSVVDPTIEVATRDMLVRERETVIRRMQAMTQEALTIEFDTDGVPFSGLEGEQAIIKVMNSRLAEIEHALASIDGGTYGLCVDCRNEIPPRRLQALPFATLCVPCQSKAEKRTRAYA